MQLDRPTSSVPADRLRLPPPARALLVVLGLAIVGVWAVAARLTPDRRGYGTHEQLGLPPCSFRLLTGKPCPSCGLTTSFCHMAHGQVGQAAAVNPTGCLLALLAAALVPWCWASAWAGRLRGVVQPDRWLLSLVGGVVSFALLVWAVRLMIERIA